MKKIILFFIVMFTGLFSSYLIHLNQVHLDKENILKEIDELLDGKKAISDGSRTVVTGSFSDNNMSFFPFSGGFENYELRKESKGFVKTTQVSGNLYYKVAEKEYVKPINEEDYYRAGYYRNTNRPDIQDIYRAGAESIIHGNKINPKKSYTQNKVSQLKSFPNGYEGKFYDIISKKHPVEKYDVLLGGGTMNDPRFTLEYKQNVVYFGFKLKTKISNENLFKNIIIGFFTGLIIYLLFYFFYFNKKKKENRIEKNQSTNTHLICNKKWKNQITNEVLIFKPNFDILFISNNVSNVGRYELNGDNLEILNENKHFILKIVEINDTELFLKDIITEQLENYIRIGD